MAHVELIKQLRWRPQQKQPRAKNCQTPSQNRDGVPIKNSQQLKLLTILAIHPMMGVLISPGFYSYTTRHNGVN